LSAGIFPERLKFSEIKPLLKNVTGLISGITDPSNYFHPSQQLLRKLYAYLVLYQHVRNNNISAKERSGECGKETSGSIKCSKFLS
jgi:hypothetical protein